MGEHTLETALERTQRDTEAALRAAEGLVAALKRARRGAQEGRLQELRRTLDALDGEVTSVVQLVKNLRGGWEFDEEAYFADGGYASELIDVGRDQGVHVFEADGLLYCYPSLLRLLPADPAVRIDKTVERRVRPTVLVNHLRDVQRRGAKFKEAAFLESLYAAYEVLAERAGKEFFAGKVERLTDIYELLTLLPGASREYSLQEFTRDVYLLDQSGTRETKRGKRVSFPAATGTRGKPMMIVTQDGKPKLYYGIAFE